MNENLAGRRIASDMPLVSIVIPVYNGVNYMREAIDSALAQTYPNIEILVINDGSTDDTEQVALSYGNRIRYFSQKNGGQSAALNRGIDEMKGEYFSWLSHDDVYYVEFIEKAVSKIFSTSNHYKTFAFADYEIINANGLVVSRIVNSDIDENNFLFNLLYQNRIHGCSVVITKQLLVEINRFNLMRPHTSDVEMLLNIAVNGKGVRIPEVLVKSRVHGDQATRRNYKYHMHETDQFGVDAFSRLSADKLIESASYVSERNPYWTLAKKWASGGYLNTSVRLVGMCPDADSNGLKSIVRVIQCHAVYYYRAFRRSVVRRLRYVK